MGYVYHKMNGTYVPGGKLVMKVINANCVLVLLAKVLAVSSRQGHVPCNHVCKTFIVYTILIH